MKNGNDLPDVEMPSLLSKEFDVSINEIVSGKQLDTDNFKKVTDNNLISALHNSAFTLKEKIAFLRKRWIKEHVANIVLCTATWFIIVIFLALKLKECNAFVLLGAVGSILTVLFYVMLYNRMMSYVEQNAYPPTSQNSDKQNDKNNGQAKSLTRKIL